MNLVKMQKELGMQSVPSCFFEIYNDIADSYEERAELILSAEYVRKTLTECFALLPYMETVLSAAERVRANPAMRLLVCILEKWVLLEERASDPGYDAPHGEGIEYDFLHLFAAIPTMPASVDFLRKRNVPEDIIAATMREYDYCFNMCLWNMGRIAFDKGRLAWIGMVIKNKLITIGRLKYELPVKRINGVRVYKSKDGEIVVFADNLHIHKSGRIVGSIYCEDEDGSFVADITETEDSVSGYEIIDGEVARKKRCLSKKHWGLFLSEDSPVIPVHIPRDGEFTQQIVEESYSRMKKVMETSFKDMPYKAVHCRTWMMSRDLRKVLKPESNILAFQNKYIHYPCKSAGTWVFGFVFPGEKGISDIENLSEKTSLQRKVKELYLNGDAIYDDCGFFF